MQMSSIIDVKVNGKAYTLYPRGGRCDLIDNDMKYTVYSQYDGNDGFYATVTVKFRRGGSRNTTLRSVKADGKVGRRVIAAALFPQA